MNKPEFWTDTAFLARFWAKVDRRGPDDCWSWLSHTIRGRGSLRYKGSDYLAPRVLKIISEEAWPSSGMMACHSCDNPNCVNPKHIWWGTNSDNLADAASKGRLPKQQRTHCKRGHELTPDNYIISKGIRRCRQCRLIHQSKWRIAQRSAQ